MRMTVAGFSCYWSTFLTDFDKIELCFSKRGISDRKRNVFEKKLGSDEWSGKTIVFPNQKFSAILDALSAWWPYGEFKPPELQRRKQDFLLCFHAAGFSDPDCMAECNE